MYIEPGNLALIGHALISSSPKTCPTDNSFVNISDEDAVRCHFPGARNGNLRQDQPPAVCACRDAELVKNLLIDESAIGRSPGRNVHLGDAWRILYVGPTEV